MTEQSVRRKKQELLDAAVDAGNRYRDHLCSRHDYLQAFRNLAAVDCQAEPQDSGCIGHRDRPATGRSCLSVQPTYSDFRIVAPATGRLILLSNKVRRLKAQ
jgi:hypothetical protein